MRTTIDLPDDVHQILLSVARDRQQGLSKTVVDIVRRQLFPGDGTAGLHRDPVTGLMVMRGSGTPITPEDVRAMEDPE